MIFASLHLTDLSVNVTRLPPFGEHAIQLLMSLFTKKSLPISSQSAKFNAPVSSSESGIFVETLAAFVEYDHEGLGAMWFETDLMLLLVHLKERYECHNIQTCDGELFAMNLVKLHRIHIR